MTNNLTSSPKHAFNDAVLTVITNELRDHHLSNTKLLQLGVLQAGASADAVKTAFGAVLGELMSSPPGLHDQDCDRVFWVDAHDRFFALHVSSKEHSECLLLIERTLAVDPYLASVVRALNSAALIKKRRIAASQQRSRCESAG